MQGEKNDVVQQLAIPHPKEVFVLLTNVYMWASWHFKYVH